MAIARNFVTRYRDRPISDQRNVQLVHEVANLRESLLAQLYGGEAGPLWL